MPGMRIRAGGSGYSTASVPEMRRQRVAAICASRKLAQFRGSAGFEEWRRNGRRKLDHLFDRSFAMNSQRIVGVVMLVIGVAVLIVGMNATNSTADQITNTFSGHYTDHTMWYMIGGGAAALFGLLVVLSGGIGGRHA
jgi:hypothetical protein